MDRFVRAFEGDGRVAASVGGCLSWGLGFYIFIVRCEGGGVVLCARETATPGSVAI